MSDAVAYLLTCHGYGTRLHGDAAGSVDRSRNRFGEAIIPAHEGLAAARQTRMAQPPFRFDAAVREGLMKSVEETSDHRGWTLLALHARLTHIHVVLRAPGEAPERVMNDLKAYATRALRRGGHVAADRRVWSRHGSTKHLFDEAAVRRAVRYTILEQGEWLAPAPGWDHRLLPPREVDERTGAARDAP